MPPIGVTLVSLLRTVERPGDFCVGGQREIIMPAIDIEGVGRISFPVLSAQVEQLIGIAESAPYGRGEETLVDPDVRRTWQIDASRVRIGGRQWQKTLDEIVADAALGLGVNGAVAADFYKLLVYDAGSFFVDHRDTEKVPGMFATMILVLPSVHRGGELAVQHLGREVVFDQHPEGPSEVGFLAFYADCLHEVRPIVSGNRVALVYNLRFLGKKSLPKPPDNRTEQRRIAERLRQWAESGDGPDKLVVPLEHAYTPAELSFEKLKGRDAAVASVLAGASEQAACDLHLALVSIEESGSADYADDHRGGRWQYASDDDAFEVGEVLDRSLTLSHMRRPDGAAPDYADFPFLESELSPPDAFENLTPDDEHFHEATGNDGASFDRSYVRAGLVLWPRARRLAVLNQAGLKTTLPHLQDLATRWQASAAGTDTPLWQEADELAGHMLHTWPSRRNEAAAEARRMLEALTLLGAVARIDSFLAARSAEGDYAASDNEAIVRAAALLAPQRASALLIQIIRHNTPTHPAECADLLKRWTMASDGRIGDVASVAAAFIGVLPGPPATRAGQHTRQDFEPVTADLVDDLLTATSLIDAGLIDSGVIGSSLANRAVGHILAWPGTYKPDSALVPAALALVKRSEARAWPAVGKLRAACLTHLRQRIAIELAAPRDWARANPISCKCTDCRELASFLIDPKRRQWHLKAAQQRRSHVESTVQNEPCDVDLATDRRGSPHMLIATKNQASHERRTAQRRADIEHEAALAG